MSTIAGDAITFPIHVVHPLTRVATAADSTPTAVLNRNGTASAETVTVTTTGDTGGYRLTFTIPTTWVAGDDLDVVLTVTVSSITQYVTVWRRQLDASRATAGVTGSASTKTLADLRASVVARVRRSDKNDEIDENINFAIEEVRKRHDWKPAKVVSSVSISANDYSVSLGAGVRKVLDIWCYDPSANGGENRIVLYDDRRFRNRFPNVPNYSVTGRPCAGYELGGTLYFAPLSDATYTLEFTCFKYPQVLTSDSDSLEILNVDQAIIAFATAETFRMLEQFNEADRWDQVFELRLRTAIMDDKRDPGIDLMMDLHNGLDYPKYLTGEPWNNPLLFRDNY